MGIHVSQHILLISIFESCYENKLELNIENCLKSKLCTVHISSVIPMKLPSFENLIGKGLIGGFCFNSVCLISQVLPFLAHLYVRKIPRAGKDQLIFDSAMLPFGLKNVH